MTRFKKYSIINNRARLFVSVFSQSSPFALYSFLENASTKENRSNIAGFLFFFILINIVKKIWQKISAIA